MIKYQDDRNKELISLSFEESTQITNQLGPVYKSS